MSDDETPTFTWLEFMALAEQLAERDDEASLRTAVSRMYYAVFHVAREVLDKHDPAFATMRGQDSHKQVWDGLGALGFRQTKSAVRAGRTLLNARRDADYRVEAKDWSKRCQTAVEQSGRALRALSELL